MRKRLNRSALTALLLCSLFTACGYRYHALRIERKADFSPMLLHRGLEPRELAEKRGEADTTAPAKGRGKVQKVRAIRHLAASASGAPASLLNDRGVRYALEGKFREAELMFSEAMKDDASFAPACNNLGVVCEIFGRREESFSMYSRACLMEPSNDTFRENFLNLSDSAVK